MKRKPIIGVMGPGESATSENLVNARKLGKYIATEGYILLTGGRATGVMAAASRGAYESDGVVIGILPGANKEQAAPWVTIPIVTDLGSARNNINILTSDVVVACGIGPGTASEIALAIKAAKPIILLDQDDDSLLFFQKIAEENQLHKADTTEQAIETIRIILSGKKKDI